MAKTYYEGKFQINELVRGSEYSVRLKMPADSIHKRRWWSKSFKIKARSKADAISKAIAIEDKLLGKRPEPSTVLFADYAREWHISRGGEDREGIRQISSSPTDLRTIDRDSVLIRRIEKYFDGVRVVDLTDTAILKAYDKFKTDGASKNMLFQLHAKVRQVLDSCVEDEVINRNPAKRIKIKRPRVSERKRQERRVTKVGAEKLMKILQQDAKTGEHAAIWIALMTGLRKGEVLALEWQHIDFDEQTLSVRGQFSELGVIKAPKSESYRTIALDEITLIWLSDWKLFQQGLFAKERKQWSVTTPVCTNEVLERISTNHLDKYQRKVFVKAGLGHFVYEEVKSPSGRIRQYERYVGATLHSLRKTHATLLIAAGVDPKTVQHRLGHASIMTTLNIYAESVDENDRAASNTFANLLTT